MKAVRAGNDIIADSLIKAKADVNFTRQSYAVDTYESALSIAQMNNSLELFQKLIGAGAKWDIAIAGTRTWTITEMGCSFRGCSFRYRDAPRALWVKAIHNPDPRYLRAILMSAKCASEVRTHLFLFVLPCMMVSFLCLCLQFAIGLHIAVHHNRPEHLKLLIDFGAPINHVEEVCCMLSKMLLNNYSTICCCRDRM